MSNVEPNSNNAQPPSDGARTGFLVVVLFLAALVVGGAFYAWNQTRPSAPGESAAQAADSGTQTGRGSKPDQPNPDAMPEPTSGTNVAAPAPLNPAITARTQPAPAAPAVPKPEPSPYTRSLVKALAEIDAKNGPITTEKMEAWKTALAQLKQQGTAGVPAILEYMAKNTDVSLEALGVAKELGASSIRMALLETLNSLGSEGLQASAQVLSTTTDPKEIAYIARSLESQAPEQFRQEILQAARDTLSMAAEGKLPGVDVGPLFGALRSYGGPNAVADLEKLASPYRYYSVIALGNLADNAGVNSLVQMVSDPNNPNKSARGPALQMLAQVSLQSPEARTAFLAQVQDGSISSATWSTIFDIVKGHRIYIGNPAEMGGNQPGDKTWQLAGSTQQFYSRQDPNFSSADVAASIDLAKEAMNKTNDPAVREGLQQAIAALQERVK
jgi:hypothetical protein